MSALLELLDRKHREVELLNMSVADWMEANVIFKANRPRPGPLKLDLWQRPIVESMQRARETDTMVWSQAGKSTMILGLIGWCIETQKATMMGFPTDLIRDRFVEHKFAPMLDNCPRLQELVSFTTYGNMKADAIPLKYGEEIPMAVSGSPGALQQMDAEYVLVDEADKFRIMAESNDPMEILKGRGRAFGERAHMVVFSTPTTTDASMIAARYDQSCRFRSFYECPLCADLTRLLFAAEEPDRIRCQVCKEMLPFDAQTETLLTQQWIADRPELVGEWDGYHINQFGDLYTPWQRILRDYNPNKPRDFFVQQMAEPFSTIAEQPPTDEELEALLRPIPDEPEWAQVGKIITVDMQRRRGGEAVVSLWSIHNTMRTPRLACRWQHVISRGDREWVAVFRELRQLYRRDRPDLMFVDAGDPHGADVNELLRAVFKAELRAGRVRAIKGWSGTDSKRWGEIGPMYHGDTLKTRAKRLGQVLTVNSAGTKSAFLMMLRQGNVCLPGVVGTDYPADILRQLSSEQLRSYVTVGGHEKLKWVKLPGRDNETLDLGTYTLAGCAYLGPQYASNFDIGPIRDFIVPSQNPDAPGVV